MDIGGKKVFQKASMFFTLGALKDTESSLGSCADWMTSELTGVSVSAVFQTDGQLLALQEGRKPMWKSAMEEGQGFTSQVKTSCLTQLIQHYGTQV